MKTKKEIRSGVYLVVDPSYGTQRVLEVTKSSLSAGATMLQLWASWKDQDVSEAIGLGIKLAELADQHSVPFLINNNLDLAIKVNADGVHIDGVEPAPEMIREKMGPSAIVGVTCSTKMEKVLWAANKKVDYISFCSMYPSTSVNECDIVPMRIVREARSRVDIPIFASGGINARNAHEVIEAGANGVAVISTIMRAKDPGSVTKELNEIVQSHRISL